MPKVSRQKATKPLRHNPLADQIIQEEESSGLRKTPRTKLQRKTRDDDDDASGVLPKSMTRKVLEVAQAQKAHNDDGGDFPEDPALGGAGQGGDGEMEEEEEEASDIDVEVDEEGFVVSQGGTEEDDRALALFMPGKGAQKAGPTLADVILGKIQEHEARKQAGQEVKSEPAGGLSPKVIQVYGEIGKWLKTYKVGKLPKAFKVVPSLTNWEEVLALTSPLTWTPAAMYEASTIFASNLNPRMAQRFFNLVLLPAVRQNIADYKRLNFHHYRALRKALFKPAGFFKGILLPLAAESCTLREAVIMSSVLAKASIPPMHSAATLARLCTMTPWYGTTSILIGALVNKKYALPLLVVETLVAHFCAFANEDRALPLVWHRALLIFVQRYKFDLNEDQRRRLKELLRIHFHDGVGPEVRRELLAPKPGEAPPSEAGPTASAMDVS